MKVVVDRDFCIGSGQCLLREPAVFDQDDDGVVTLVTDEPGAALEPSVREAATRCPASAIRIEG